MRFNANQRMDLMGQPTQLYAETECRGRWQDRCLVVNISNVEMTTEKLQRIFTGFVEAFAEMEDYEIRGPVADQERAERVPRMIEKAAREAGMPEEEVERLVRESEADERRVDVGHPVAAKVH